MSPLVVGEDEFRLARLRHGIASHNYAHAELEDRLPFAERALQAASTVAAYHRERGHGAMAALWAGKRYRWELRIGGVQQTLLEREMGG